MKNRELCLLEQYNRYLEWARPFGIAVHFEKDGDGKIECAVVRSSKNKLMFERCYSFDELVGFLKGMVINGCGFYDGGDTDTEEG